MSKEITLLTPSYLPRFGGVERHVHEVAKQLSEMGHHITILTAQHDEKLSLFEETEFATVIRRPQNATSKFHTWLWVWQQRSHLLNANIVHAHDVFWWLAPIYPFIHGKVFTTFHGWEGQYPIRWQAKLHRLIAARLSQKTMHVGAWIKEFYWDSPNITSYGGVSLLTKQPILLEQNKVPHFVFLGRLDSGNDIELYLQFVRELTNLLPSLKVTWVGDGQYAEKCRRTGKVTGMVAKPHRFLKSATIVGASSYLSMFESLGEAKPVVALYSHHLKERYLKCFPETQVLFLNSSPAKAAHFVKEALENTKYFNTLKRQCLEAAKRHTWQVVTEYYLQMWEVSEEPSN